MRHDDATRQGGTIALFASVVLVPLTHTAVTVAVSNQPSTGMTALLPGTLEYCAAAPLFQRTCASHSPAFGVSARKTGGATVHVHCER